MKIKATEQIGGIVSSFTNELIDTCVYKIEQRSDTAFEASCDNLKKKFDNLVIAGEILE